MSKSLNSSTSAKGFTSELVRRRTLTSSFFSDHSIIVLNFSSLTFILFGSVLLCRTTSGGLTQGGFLPLPFNRSRYRKIRKKCSIEDVYPALRFKPIVVGCFFCLSSYTFISC